MVESLKDPNCLQALERSLRISNLLGRWSSYIDGIGAGRIEFPRIITALPCLECLVVQFKMCFLHTMTLIKPSLLKVNVHGMESGICDFSQSSLPNGIHHREAVTNC